MRIGILGAGNMAEALATRWAQAGHDLLIGARDEHKARRLAERIGNATTHGTPRAAAEHGEAVLLAVPYPAIEDALTSAGAPERTLDGRVLIDCTNPLDMGNPLPITNGHPSAAAHVASVAEGARVIKAFNLATPSVWSLNPPTFDGEPLAVPVCGDDPHALELVHRLVRDLGCVPLDAGRLDRAGLQESALAFLVGLWFKGLDARTALPPVGALG